MAENKKAAVMIYPYFSLQEITCLTSCLALWYERKIVVFAASMEAVQPCSPTTSSSASL